MSDRPSTIAEMLAPYFVAFRDALHTAIVARIVRYDAATQKADCKPLIKQAYLDESGERQVQALPVIPSVPVFFPGGGGYRLTFPITASDTTGDTCLLVFSEASLDRWLTGTGREVDPEIDHRHGLMDAVAFVGLKPFGAPWTSVPTDEATIGYDTGVQIHMEPSVITIGDKSGAQFVALANLVQGYLTKIEAAVAAWTPVLNDGGAALKVQLTTQGIGTGAGFGSNCAATQVKAK
jgi:hypothetical protein